MQRLSITALAAVTVLPLVLLVGGCSLAPPPGSLSGQWAPTSAQLGGNDFPVARFAGATLRLVADTYEFSGDRGTYSVLSTQPPAWMDIQGREGPNAGKTILAIYDLYGDELTICYQLGAGERPTAFVSPPGSRILLVRYRRLP